MSFSALCFFDNITLNELSKKATVAQLAEHLICNQRVGGSIPFGGSKKAVRSNECSLQ